MMPTVRRPAEELPVGQPVDCGSHEISEAEILEFAQHWDPQYFHVDPQAAATSEFGGIIASGLHTTAIFQRLLATGLLTSIDVIAGRMIRECRFLQPVWPGDELTATVTIRSVSPPKYGRSEALFEGRLTNQHGMVVLEMELDILIRSRTANGA